jgi:hypothetical protein
MLTGRRSEVCSGRLGGCEVVVAVGIAGSMGL